MVLQVKRLNQHYQSTEGTNATKVLKKTEKANNRKYSKTINTQKKQKIPQFTIILWVTRVWLPHRAGSPILNGGGTGAMVSQVMSGASLCIEYS